MSLQVWLPLNGDLHNQGLTQFNPTINTNPTWTNNGKIGQALMAGQITMPAAATSQILNNQEFSFACWIYIAAETGSTSDRAMIFGNNPMSANNNRKFSIFQYPTCNDLHLSWQNDTANQTFAGGVWNGVFPSNQWTHLAITYNNPNGKIYINGVQYATFSGTSNSASFNYDTILFSNCPNNGRYLNDYRIYNHCLSPEEVKKISQGLVLHYQLCSNIKLINPNLLPDTNVSSLNKVVAPYARYYESSGNGTYTKAFETISDPPVDGIRYGVHYKVTSVSGFHGVTWYSGGLVSVETGQQYTLSCYAKKITTGTTITLKFQYGKSPYVSGTVNMIDDTDWHQYSWTFTPNTNSNQAAAGGTTRIYGPGLSTVGEAIICGYKLEKGNIATRWCEYGEVFPPPVDKIYDSSGFNNNGVLNDDTAVNISSNFKYQQAIKNNQSTTSDTYLLKGNINMPESSTLSFTWWMNPTQLGHQTSGIFSTSSESLPTDYQTTAANMRDSCFDCCNSAGTCVRISVSEYLTLNEWHYYALVYNGSQLIFYKDGEQKCSVNQTGKLKGFTSIFPFYSKAGGISRTTSGSLSDFKIYVTALSADDIMKSYKDSLTTAGIPRDLE